MKITFIFILILFIDSVNRVYRVQIELGLSSENGGANGYAPSSTKPFSFFTLLPSLVRLLTPLPQSCNHRP